MPSTTASTNSNLSFRIAEFETLVDGLDYAASGETGCNFFSPRGELQDSLTYCEIRDRAVALAQRLSRTGVERGARVALVAETGPDFLIFFYGCQYAGLIPVPLPLTIHLGGHDAYVDRLRTMIAKAGAEIAVGPADMLHYLKEAAADGRMVGTPGDFYSLPAEGGDLRPFGKDEACYIQYSSGSTSLPRGVFVSQRAITSNARGIGRHGLSLRPGDRATSWLPLYHDMGLVGFCLTPMLSQITIDYLATKSFALRPLTCLKLIYQHGGTIYFPPTFASPHLPLQPALRLRSLRHARPQRLGQDHRPVALARRRYRRRDGARRDARALLPDLCRYRLLAQGLPAELRPRRIHPGSDLRAARPRRRGRPHRPGPLHPYRQRRAGTPSRERQGQRQEPRRALLRDLRRRDAGPRGRGAQREERPPDRPSCGPHRGARAERDGRLLQRPARHRGGHHARRLARYRRPRLHDRRPSGGDRAAQGPGDPQRPEYLAAGRRVGGGSARGCARQRRRLLLGHRARRQRAHDRRAAGPPARRGASGRAAGRERGG